MRNNIDLDLSDSPQHATDSYKIGLQGIMLVFEWNNPIDGLSANWDSWN